MRRGEQGSIVMLFCDAGERYRDTYFADDWFQARGIFWEEAGHRCTTLLADARLLDEP